MDKKNNFDNFQITYIDEANDKLYETLTQLAHVYNNEKKDFKEKEELFLIIDNLEEVRQILFQVRNNYYRSVC